MSTNYLKDLALKYLDCGKVVIPVLGKAPRVNNWTKYCDNLPTVEELDSWDWKNATGIGLTIGKANRICAVDIDNATNEEIEIINNNTPASQYVRVGKKGEGRLYRTPQNFDMPVRQIKKNNRVIVEFFYANKQLVIPPSEHPETKLRYKWTHEQFGPDTDWDDIPELGDNRDILIEKLLLGNKVDKSKILSPGENRWDRATSYLSSLARQNRYSFDELVMLMIQWDHSTNSNNLYFLDRSKGWRANEEKINAMKFVADNFYGYASKKQAGESLDMPVFSRAIKHNMVFGAIEPIKIDEKKIEFDDSCIPKSIKKYINDVNENSGVPKESVLILMMASLSALIGNKVIIQPNPSNDMWIQSPNIYAMVSDNPGSLKTFISSLSMSCLKLIEDKHNKEYKDAKSSQEAMKKIVGPQIKITKSQLDKAASEGDGKRMEELAIKLARLESSIEDPQRRVIRSQTSTPEALVDIVMQSSKGHLIFENEFSCLQKMYMKKGYELMRKIHLDGWDGTEGLMYTTKSGGHKSCNKFCLSMIVNTQNDIIEKFIKESFRDKTDDGLFARFIYIRNKTSPKINFESKLESVPEKIQKIFLDADDLEEQEKRVFFAKDAQNIANNFMSWTLEEAQKRQGVLSSAISKSRSHFTRLAYLLQFCDYGHKDTISKEYMESAIKISMLSIDCIKELQEKTDRTSQEILDTISDIVRSGDFLSDPFTIKPLQKCDPSLYKNKYETNEALLLLCKTNRLKLVNDNGVERYYINPAWKEELQK